MANEQKENLMIRSSNFILRSCKILHSEPLWKRVPTRDRFGKPYTDFMMLIPGLRNFEPLHLRDIISKMEAVLMRYEDDIILAELNLKINILWVTMQPQLGLTAEIAAMIHHVVPEAKLVSQHTAKLS
jgi:hypothetical protein